MTVRYSFLVALLATVLAHPAAAAVDPAVLTADGAFVKAATSGDAKGVEALLDQDLTWTDQNGATVTRTQAAKTLPKLAIANPAGADMKQYDYGNVAVVLVNAGKLHTVRVWAKRPAGWRLLVVQDVRSLDGTPQAVPSAGPKCENPCGAVPYTPKTATEKAVIEAYKSLEEAAMGHKGKEWRSYAADEIALASSNGDKVFDKETRAVAIEKAAMGGVAPTKLLTAQLLDFGTTVVMRSKHQPDKGDLLQITRVWVKRDGRWQETLSYQTGIRQGSK